MRDNKKEDRDYLNQFKNKNKNVGDLLDMLSTEAAKLKSIIQDIMKRANKK